MELSVYPHGRLAAVYTSELAFAHAFSRRSQLPVLVSPLNARDPYDWRLVDAERVYAVDEWPEDEATVAITVTAANKKQLPAP